MATRAFKFCIDSAALTSEQSVLLDRHAGTARAVFNWALAIRNDAYEHRWRYLKDQASAETPADGEARVALLRDEKWRKQRLAAANNPQLVVPSMAELSRRFTAETKIENSRFFWWSSEAHGVNRFAMSSALRALDVAFQRYFTMPVKKTGRPRKDGKPAGWPRFKKKGRDILSFAICNLGNAGKAPRTVVQGGHRIKIPSLGSLRVHDDTKRLRRLINRGGIPKTASFSRVGGRWYVSITVSVDEQILNLRGPARVQRANGAVGVDLGIRTFAAISSPTCERLENGTPQHRRRDQHLQRKARRLSKALTRRQGPYDQTAKERREPSKSWRRTKDELAKTKHLIAVRQQGQLHRITKTLATQHVLVAVEDLNVSGMMARPAPKPDPEQPGAFLSNGRAGKRGLARSVARASFHEFRRQLAYKASWYGSELAVIGRFEPSSKTCSECGWVKPKLSLGERVFECDECGFSLDRDLNAARNIRRFATLSPVDVGDTKRRPANPARSSWNRGIGAQDPDTRVSAARNGPPIPTQIAS